MQRYDMARNRVNAAARQREVKWLGKFSCKAACLVGRIECSAAARQPGFPVEVEKLQCSVTLTWVRLRLRDTMQPVEGVSERCRV